MSGQPTDTLRWVRAATVDDLNHDEPLAVVVEGIAVALFKDGDQYFALGDICSHGAARLSEGYVEDGCVECPLHQALFDLATGEPTTGPAVEPVRSFSIRLDGDAVMIGL